MTESRIIMTYHRIPIQKAVVYLSSEEIHRLLLKDTDLFCEALSRGKAFKRANDLNTRVKQKRSEG